ncbi:MAG: hypothetical protein IKQ77_09195 [Prevotella sp.]|nr:hypothetical protein [Prevotella sp.]
MRITVNNQEVVLFHGATVRDAMNRLFVKNGISRDILSWVVVYDQWGHEIDLDAPLTADAAITYEINKQP